MLPFFRRLGFGDYQRLFLTWTILLLDGTIRLVLSIVPTPLRTVLDRWCYRFLGLWPRVFRAQEPVEMELNDDGDDDDDSGEILLVNPNGMKEEAMNSSGRIRSHPVGKLQHSADICSYW